MQCGKPCGHVRLEHKAPQVQSADSPFLLQLVRLVLLLKTAARAPEGRARASLRRIRSARTKAPPARHAILVAHLQRPRPRVSAPQTTEAARRLRAIASLRRT